MFEDPDNHWYKVLYPNVTEWPCREMSLGLPFVGFCHRGSLLGAPLQGLLPPSLDRVFVPRCSLVPKRLLHSPDILFPLGKLRRVYQF